MLLSFLALEIIIPKNIEFLSFYVLKAIKESFGKKREIIK